MTDQNRPQADSHRKAQAPEGIGTTPGKRLLDICLVALGAGPALALSALIGALLLAVQGRPLLFGQLRCGAGGRPFVMWKFRTMRPGPDESGITGGHQSGRITPVGTVLRRTHLDELPQLWNVLIGDMSLVGPRPPLPGVVDRFPAVYAHVLALKPGLTGLASLVFARRERALVSAAADANSARRIYETRCVRRKARLDLIYRQNRSLGLDLMILAGTLAGGMPRAVRRIAPSPSRASIPLASGEGGR